MLHHMDILPRPFSTPHFTDTSATSIPLDPLTATMPTLVPLPNELILHAISYLPLKSLIACRSVGRQWRHLATAADTHPARRELLKLYLTIAHSCKLAPGYSQIFKLPEDFRLWILEWPTRAAIGCVWPGLPRVACYRVLADDIERFNGTNWLETIPPMVSAVTWTVPDPLDTFDTFDFLPAILIRAHSYHIWLILDDDEELREEGTLQLRDKVFTTIHGDKHIIDQRGFSECDEVDANWVAWQTRMWAKIENAAERGPILDSNIVITFGIPMPDDHVCITNTWENRFNPRPRMDYPLDGLRVHNE